MAVPAKIHRQYQIHSLGMDQLEVLQGLITVFLTVLDLEGSFFIFEAVDLMVE